MSGVLAAVPPLSCTSNSTLHFSSAGLLTRCSFICFPSRCRVTLYLFFDFQKRNKSEEVRSRSLVRAKVTQRMLVRVKQVHDPLVSPLFLYSTSSSSPSPPPHTFFSLAPSSILWPPSCLPLSLLLVLVLPLPSLVRCGRAR